MSPRLIAPTNPSANKHLGIEAVGAKFGGAAVILREIVSTAARTEMSKITVFCSPRNVRQFRLPQSPKIVEVECAEAERSAIGRVRWMMHGVAAEVRHRGIDLLLCMGELALLMWQPAYSYSNLSHSATKHFVSAK